LVGAGHASTLLRGSQVEIDGSGGFKPQNHHAGMFTSLGLRIRAHPLRPDGDVDGMWCQHETGIEAKRSREGSMFVRCYDKKLDDFTPNGYLG
jgi:hypothetical protein